MAKDDDRKPTKPRRMLKLRKEQAETLTVEQLERRIGNSAPTPYPPPDSYSECFSICIPCAEEQ